MTITQSLPKKLVMLECPVPGLVLRAERPGDAPALRALLTAAFPGPLEAQLVDDLRRAGRLTISWLALRDEQIVGQIAFSPVTLNGVPCGLGLGPLSVSLAHRKQGIGAALVQAGLAQASFAQAGFAQCSEENVGFAVVLGDPRYYARFGFRPAASWQLRDEYQGGPAFQALEFRSGAIPTTGGLVQYAPEFALFADEA